MFMRRTVGFLAVQKTHHKILVKQARRAEWPIRGNHSDQRTNTDPETACPTTQGAIATSAALTDRWSRSSLLRRNPVPTHAQASKLQSVWANGCSSPLNRGPGWRHAAKNGKVSSIAAERSPTVDWAARSPRPSPAAISTAAVPSICIFGLDLR